MTKMKHDYFLERGSSTDNNDKDNNNKEAKVTNNTSESAEKHRSNFQTNELKQTMMKNTLLKIGMI